MRTATPNWSRYESLRREALTAFSSDPEYAIDMVESARAIKRKRDVWELRKHAREAEETAQAQCRASAGFCNSLSPCGFGDCAFATAGDSKVVIVSLSGESMRPVPARYSHYRRGDILGRLMEMRGLTNGT